MQRIAFADQPHESSFAPASRLQRSIVIAAGRAAVHQEGGTGNKRSFVVHQKLCHVGYLVCSTGTARGTLGKHVFIEISTRAVEFIDGQGRHVDFSNTVIIMTSNIGARDIAQTTTMGFSASGASGLSDKEITSRVTSELKKLFRPEFLNRVDEIVVFKSLSGEQLRGIVELMVSDLRDRLIANGMSINLTDAARDLVAKRGTDPIYGARPLRRAIQTLIEDPLSEELLEGKWQRGDIIEVDANGDELVFSKGTGEIPAPRKHEHMELPSARDRWSVDAGARPSPQEGGLAASGA